MKCFDWPEQECSQENCGYAGGSGTCKKVVEFVEVLIVCQKCNTQFQSSLDHCPLCYHIWWGEYRDLIDPRKQ
jgi:hypothetical protein